MRFAILAVSLALALATPVAAEPIAKQLFGAKATPAPMDSAAIGSYAKGCLAGGKALPWNGPHHQVMRLSRNRYWGHPELIAYLDKLEDAAATAGWAGLLIGDMAQPRGGPMVSGHASHQVGLDVDIWFTPMPDHMLSNDEREKVSAVSMLTKDFKELDPEHWSDVRVRLLKAAASFEEVARIFVNPVIKRELCAVAGEDRGWLRKIRPWGGHDDHFHVRLSCPPGSAGCHNQAPPAAGDGCGADLAKWFKPPPKQKEKKKTAPPPKKHELTLADLPAACAQVLKAE